MDVQSNWWETFFHGVAVDLWINAVLPEQNAQEAARLAALLNAPAGAELLDVPCGAGRLALALASRGFRMTGVDWSEAFLDHARAADRDGAVRWERRDMRDLPWRARFDGAFCVGNSFAYLDDEGNAAFLRAVASALKPGAPFVLETPMVVESLVRTIKDRFWVKAGDIHLLVSNRYDAARGRLDIEYTFVSNGRIDVRSGTHRAYTYRQLIELFEASGFAVEPAEEWTLDARQLVLVGRRLPGV
jgi:SAM-dependent methyltransferase